MTITREQILNVVNKRLGRNETNIDEQIRSTLKDISDRAPFLEGKEQITTEADTKMYVPPDNLRTITKITLEENGERPIEIKGLNNYLRLSAGNTSPARPRIAAYFNAMIWLFPTPDKEYTVNIYLSQYHPDDVTEILFPPEFRELIYQGTLCKVAETYQLDNDLNRHIPLYEMEMEKRINALSRKRPPAIIRYWDL